LSCYFNCFPFSCVPGSDFCSLSDMSIPRKASNKSHETSALIAGIAAFTTWGLVPIYWKLLKAVPATEILAHRFVYRNGFARSVGHRLSHLPKDERPINVRAGEHFIVDLVGEYRHCHRLAAGLVRARRAAFAPYDAWFFAVSGTNRHIFPRRVCLPRVIHAQRSYHVRDDLDRARHLYRRSGYPMAFGADTRSSNIARGISIVTV